VRFIHYFEAFYKNIVKSPMLKKLTKISLFSVPNTSSSPLQPRGSKLYFEVYRLRDNFKQDLLYTNKHNKEEVIFNHEKDGVINL